MLTLERAHIEMEEMVVSAARGVLQNDNAIYIETRKIDELNAIPDRMAGLISSIPEVYQASGGSGVSKPVIRGCALPSAFCPLVALGIKLFTYFWRRSKWDGFTFNATESLNNFIEILHKKYT